MYRKVELSTSLHWKWSNTEGFKSLNASNSSELTLTPYISACSHSKLWTKLCGRKTALEPSCMQFKSVDILDMFRS